jgi:hypothetical protein
MLPTTKYLNIKPWTIALLALILVDSAYTSYLSHMGYAKEGNPLILGIMKTFGWSLDTAMVARIFFCLPFLYVLNKWNWSKFTLIAYVGIYVLLTGLL